jgi:hypothetical protein
MPDQQHEEASFEITTYTHNKWIDKVSESAIVGALLTRCTTGISGEWERNGNPLTSGTCRKGNIFNILFSFMPYFILY